MSPSDALWIMSLFAKLANDGKATPRHQDGEFRPIRPLATGTVFDRALTAAPARRSSSRAP